MEGSTIVCQGLRCADDDTGPTTVPEDVGQNDDLITTIDLDMGPDLVTDTVANDVLGTDLVEVTEEITPVFDGTVAEDMGLNCEDRDADGFYECIDPAYPDRPEEVDCDDERWLSQPGGAEFPDNGFDDDCDGLIDEIVDCVCNTGYNSPVDDVVSSMGLCEWILSSSRRGNVGAFGVVNQYFSAVTPREGECLGIMSTGKADATVGGGGGGFGGSSSGVQPGHEFNMFDTSPDPDPEAEGGGGGPGGSGNVYDLAQIILELTPPPNASGFQFDHMFMSAEWPEYLCQIYNDTFYTIVETEGVNHGDPTNVTFDLDGDEITVNVGYFELPSDWTVNIGPTPFGQADPAGQCDPSSATGGCVLPDYCSGTMALRFIGSGSGWLTTQVPIVNGEETISVVLSVHDEGDAAYDTMMLLDNFQWLPFSPEEGTIKE
jgi:hypothetical protein